MREKELRLALICYGGVSLAVYMHGITKEIWRLARASRAFHDGEQAKGTSERVYCTLFDEIEQNCGVRLRAMVDIIAGASAGGLNAIFLADAIVGGRSLEPLTRMWLEKADVDELLSPDTRPVSRFTKFWATPIAWAVARRRGGTVDTTVSAEARDEVSAKLSRLVRARWFQPPFSGKTLIRLLLDAFGAIEQEPAGPPLLPAGQPLDLFVTVTDFHGYPQRLKLHSPPEITETEHRLTLSFSDQGTSPRNIGSIVDLSFAARATASFPGAFPPFNVAELDEVLAEREIAWPGRDRFLKRVLPRQWAATTIDRTLLIDGSVLANAPFAPAIAALRHRPARREIDRRFVYIDPKPGQRSIGLGRHPEERPGFFRTVYGALSDIPREQPINDNLEAIELRSRRIRRMARVMEAIRPEVESVIERVFGRTLFLNRPTAARLAGWRAKAQKAAAQEAGYAFASYNTIKLSGIVEEVITTMVALGAGTDVAGDQAVRGAIWDFVRELGLEDDDEPHATLREAAFTVFFRTHDLSFRVRRLRVLLRRLSALEETDGANLATLDAARDAIHAALSLYLERQRPEFFDEATRAAVMRCREDPGAALAALAEARDLRSADAQAETLLVDAFAAPARFARRSLILAYLGFPFFDIATLPFLQGEGLDEFDPVKVDRIAPEDARSIREGGAAATLKGIEFNSFGAFFSRAYRENDYLWGRLHGAERLIDIVVSAIPEPRRLPAGRVGEIKRDAFRAILVEERDRLTAIEPLFEDIEARLAEPNAK